MGISFVRDYLLNPQSTLSILTTLTCALLMYLVEGLLIQASNRVNSVALRTLSIRLRSSLPVGMKR